MIKSMYEKAVKFDQDNNLITICPYMTIKDVIQYTQLGDWTIREAIKKGQLKAYKVGKLIRTTIQNVDEFMETYHYPTGA